MPDDRPLREKLEEMAARGTTYERERAVEALARLAAREEPAESEGASLRAWILDQPSTPRSGRTRTFTTSYGTKVTMDEEDWDPSLGRAPNQPA